MRVHQQQAYILLNRPYTETSWIVEVFSKDFGRLALMAKGARRIKSHLKGILLPFQPVLLSWSGKGEIPTLTSAEIDQSMFNLIEHELRGDALVCGFYCNELIANLLHRHDPHKQLFNDYHHAIMALNNASEDDNLSEALRDFEQKLMKEIGYEVSFEFEADSKTPIDSAGHYRFQASQGFLRVGSNQAGAITGDVILNMVNKSSSNSSLGKHLMRDILSQTLGSKKIVSRELFYPKSVG